jgi:hypothetical protein
VWRRAWIGKYPTLQPTISRVMTPTEDPKTCPFLTVAGRTLASMPHPIVEQLRFTRSEWLRALRGVPEEDGFRRFEPMNSIGWTVAHMGWSEQRNFLTRAQELIPVPVVNEVAPNGGPATTPSLNEMLVAWNQVTTAADPWLDAQDSATLTQPLPGQPPRSVGDAIHRITYHYWFHAGEIMAIRQLLDHPDRPEFVGLTLETEAPYRPE